MHGLVAAPPNDLHLGHDHRRHEAGEGRLVQAGAEVALVGLAQRGVVLVHPLDEQLERAARVERRGAGVASGIAFRAPRLGRDRRETLTEEVEVAHPAVPFMVWSPA